MKEVLFEFTKVGNSVRVNALDSETGIEAVVIVPSALSQEQMKQLALKKLEYLLNKKNG